MTKEKKEKVGIDMKNSSNIKIINSRFHGFDKAVKADNVSGLEMSGNTATDKTLFARAISKEEQTKANKEISRRNKIRKVEWWFKRIVLGTLLALIGYFITKIF